VLGELFGREFAGLDVAFVQFRIVLPFLRQVVQGKNRGHRADRYAGATIDAFHRVNVELWNVVECWATVVIGRVLLGVDAIYGTGVNAGGVFVPMQGSAMNRPWATSRYRSQRYARSREHSSGAEVNSWRMAPTIEKISAVTFRVANMAESVRSYREVLAMELLHGGEDACFSSLRAKDAQSAILNLEQGDKVTHLGAADLLRHGCGRFLDSFESKEALIQKSRETPPGENAISTCLIRTATSCRLPGH
jgi:hypothetical protein